MPRAHRLQSGERKVLGHDPSWRLTHHAERNKRSRLIELWRDPSIRAVVIQSRPEDAGFLTQYSVEELNGLASDPASSQAMRDDRRPASGVCMFLGRCVHAPILKP